MTHPSPPEAFICPLCLRRSHHPRDAAERFCGVCGFVDDVAINSRIAGLKAAVARCDERRKMHMRDAKRYETCGDQSSCQCLIRALEAWECAIQIKELVEEAARAEAPQVRPG